MQKSSSQTKKVNGFAAVIPGAGNVNKKAGPTATAGSRPHCLNI